MALSFATDIRPLFRDTPDMDGMKEYGLDLSSYEDVKRFTPHSPMAVFPAMDLGKLDVLRYSTAG
jgi:hypothetical protein